MPAVAPDIALLRNQIIQTLCAHCTLQEIADELKITRQSVWKLVSKYGLDGRPPARRLLTEDERHIIQVAETFGVKPLVPIVQGQGPNPPRQRRRAPKRG